MFFHSFFRFDASLAFAGSAGSRLNGGWCGGCGRLCSTLKTHPSLVGLVPFSPTASAGRPPCPRRGDFRHLVAESSSGPSSAFPRHRRRRAPRVSVARHGVCVPATLPAASTPLQRPTTTPRVQGLRPRLPEPCDETPYRPPHGPSQALAVAAPASGHARSARPLTTNSAPASGPSALSRFGPRCGGGRTFDQGRFDLHRLPPPHCPYGAGGGPRTAGRLRSTHHTLCGSPPVHFKALSEAVLGLPASATVRTPRRGRRHAV